MSRSRSRTAGEPHGVPDLEGFVALVEGARGGGGRVGKVLAVPMSVAMLSDQLTPVVAYRRLVAPDARTAPSFLFESVEGGERQGRYSYLGSRPCAAIRAGEAEIAVTHEVDGAAIARLLEAGVDRGAGGPLEALKGAGAGMVLVRPGEEVGRRAGLPSDAFLGGWVGSIGYDSARYAEPGKLGFEGAPEDDRGLDVVEFSFYAGVVVFDHATKLVHVVRLVIVEDGDDLARLHEEASARLAETVGMLRDHSEPMESVVLVEGEGAGPGGARSNLTREQHREMVAKAKAYIRAGDVFQVVVGQRFERRSSVDPFDLYRALRVVNPSPYMVYMQGARCMLIASSPEILCRVRRRGDGSLLLTNRPLAGTRKRGATVEEDLALERELLADEKERAEHVMLVDLGRNDVGRVCAAGTVEVEELMAVERYSHVMHISSTVTGVLREGLDAWDALSSTLPVGTISGAPKIRAMQIIDELEPVRRGPYGGGIGCAGLDGSMDIALALRTVVVPHGSEAAPAGGWCYHIQSAGGIVYDSDADAEYDETVNKAAAMLRAIDVAEGSFGEGRES